MWLEIAQELEFWPHSVISKREKTEEGNVYYVKKALHCTCCLFHTTNAGSLGRTVVHTGS